MKFRKKTVVIEAEQFLLAETHPSLGVAKIINMPDGVVQKRFSDQIQGDYTKYGVQTLEGFMECKHGDWIITGIKGEKYPCKPNVFEQTYEPVE